MKPCPRLLLPIDLNFLVLPFRGQGREKATHPVRVTENESAGKLKNQTEHCLPFIPFRTKLWHERCNNRQSTLLRVFPIFIFSPFTIFLACLGWEAYCSWLTANPFLLRCRYLLPTLIIVGVPLVIAFLKIFSPSSLKNFGAPVHFWNSIQNPFRYFCYARHSNFEYWVISFDQKFIWIPYFSNSSARLQMHL